jgi:hypothetical protein
VGSIGNRSRAASASWFRTRPAASAAVTGMRSSGVRGNRSFQIRTHLVGVTPGTYPSLKEEGGTPGPVTRPDYRAGYRA